MRALRPLVVALAAVAMSAVPALAAGNTKKKSHTHHVVHGVLEKVEDNGHRIVVKVHAKGKDGTTTNQTSGKRGSKKKANHHEMTFLVTRHTKIHSQGKKGKDAAGTLKVGEHVVVHASGHEAKEIDILHARPGKKK